MNMNTDLYVDFMRRYGTLTAEAEADLRGRVQALQRAKGQTIIRTGQVASSFFLEEKGVVRSYYPYDDKQITIWFACENDSAVSTSSLFNDQPSCETVECIEDCRFLYITNRDFRDLRNKYDCVNTISRKMTEEYCIVLNNRIYSFQVLSAAERYRELQETEPDVVQRAPLQYIASYLGISQETLSRIRH